MANINKFFQDIFGWVHKAEQKVDEVFATIFGSQAAANFFSSAKQLLETEIGVLAKDAVLFAENATAGADKKALAVAKLGADLKTAGKSVPTSVLNLLIEMAVQGFTSIKL